MHKIRKVNLTDLENIKDVSRHLHDSTFTTEDFERSIGAIEQSETDYFLVAECEGKVVGWIHYFQARRVATPSFIEIGPAVFRQELSVTHRQTDKPNGYRA